MNDVNGCLPEAIRNHPAFERVGMVLTHTGIVRGFSRDGRKVAMIDLAVDAGNLDDVIVKHKQMPGIVEIVVDIASQSTLMPGDRIMTVSIAGDIRENVLGAMGSIIDAIKAGVTHKTEHYA